MSIEQIAQEVAQEMPMDAAFAVVKAEVVHDFLRRCLSKLAEQDVEPVADVVWFDPTIEPFQKAKPYKIIDGSLSFMDEARIGTKLYTETQLLAAQQRTAEACAKVCEARYDKACFEMGAYPDGYDLSEAIRNGDWREYL